ncbi:hypothetical protein ACNITG_27445, partial [Escherichia coli]
FFFRGKKKSPGEETSICALWGIFSSTLYFPPPGWKDFFFVGGGYFFFGCGDYFGRHALHLAARNNFFSKQF